MILIRSYRALIFLLPAIILSSCIKENKNLAGVKHFYFEFNDNIQSTRSTKLILDLANILPEYDYIMSEESAAKGWPFYGKVTRGSKVLKSEMMPPHTNVNRLSPMEALTADNENEHTLKVDITLKQKNDSIITISKESFEWSHDEWRKFSKKMVSDFNIEKNSPLELADKVSKTLIRYTFK